MAQSAEEFYKGKTIRLTVGYAAGGGHDTNSRLLSRHMGQFIPGNPNIIVQNMPGASSMKAVQYLDAGAPTDGTAFVAFSSGLVTESLTRPDQVHVNLGNYAWIGSLSQEIRVCYLRSALGIKSWGDVMKSATLTFGETGRGSASYIDGAILKDVLGVSIKQILGYGGTAEKNLAIERGELDGNCVSLSSVPNEWIRDGRITVISKGTPAKLTSIPADVPYVLDLATDPEKKKLIQFLLLPSIVGRPFMASKSVPADRVAVLREAFKRSFSSPALLAEAEKLELPIVGPLTGEEAAAYVAQLQSFSPELLAAARKITAE